MIHSLHKQTKCRQHTCVIEMYDDDLNLIYQRRERATADKRIRSINATTPRKDPIKEPEVRSQKELNCRQMANQFAFAFPLCAKYTIDAAAEAPAVKRPSIAYNI